MSMIEVDPKLFITCRLCLEEMGQYQIVPKVQMQIKFCFEIIVEPFDGLPQLICKKCESILSQYAGIKQMYQEKQSNFMEKIKKNVKNPETIENDEPSKEENNIQQQQDTVSSTQHIDTANKDNEMGKKEKRKKLSLSLRIPKKVPSSDLESITSKYNDISTNDEDKPQTITKKVTTKENTAWAGDYNKAFVCKICTKAYKDKKNVISHIKKHESLVTKHSNVLNSHFVIAMNKVGGKPNITKNTNYVVCSKDKIIKSENALYYIVYNAKVKRDRSLSSTTDDDDEFVTYVTKYKRQRLISEDFNDVVVEEKNRTSENIEKQNGESDNNDSDDHVSERNVECVNVDSDSTSIQSNETTKSSTPKPKKVPQLNKMTVTDIIKMCHKKYANKYDPCKNLSMFKANMESFLQHKFLSMGTKIVHKSLNSTGLLRYLEHKALDVNWIQSKNSLSNIIIKATLKDPNANNNVEDYLKSITHFIQDHPTQDFVDIFEDVLTNVQKKSPEDVGKDDASVAPSPIITSNNSNIENQVKKTNNSILDTLLRADTEIENGKEAVLVLRSSQDSDKQNCTKILNANPVANPKQLPNKKSTVNESPSLLTSPSCTPMPSEILPNLDGMLFKYNKEESRMPVITSTVSLASYSEEKRKVNNTPSVSQTEPQCSGAEKNLPRKRVKPVSEEKQQVNNSPSTSQTKPQNYGTETNLPRIKVKPVSELMPDKSVKKKGSSLAITGWTVTSSKPMASNTSMVYAANAPQYTPMLPQSPSVICYPQRVCSVSNNAMGVAQSHNFPNCNQVSTRVVTQECVKMHTVELPNTTTNSPYQYFQKLLQIHNLVLLDSTAIVTDVMKCLIKFTLGFQQENNAPVSLCLTLFCDQNVFCIKVRDTALKEMDISKLSANWQWEILKVFKGDIVNKLNINALKHGLDMSSKVNYFVNLLKSIIFTK